MSQLDPTFLLQHPAVVTKTAPWCRQLDNLHLSLLLLTQPWMSRQGQRRADLERGLMQLDQQMPVGPIYFQRVKRAVANLEEQGSLIGRDAGRARRFVLTERGFAALILNLCALFTDPTVDAREFEFKRSLIALWNVTIERFNELPEPELLDEQHLSFFAKVEQVTALGQRVVDEATIAAAMDVQRLIADQRQKVEQLRQAADEKMQQLAAQTATLRQVELARALGDLMPEAGPWIEDAQTLNMIQNLATRTLPELSLRAHLLRYDAFLGYLDELADLYARQLKVADLKVFSRRV